MMRLFQGLLMLITTIFLGQCTSKTDNPVPATGSLSLYINHAVDHHPLVTDELIYTNAAGNRYLVNEIQYFISDVKLWRENGSYRLLDDWNDIHYVDTDLPDTWTWAFPDTIAPGTYSKLTFTFGISEEKNQSLMFVNPPESFMFWPENLGGGYHYMKLNGKWEDPMGELIPFDFHLGIGQIYESYPDSIIGFVQNYFEVEIPFSTITIEAGKRTVVGLSMQVDQWFTNPYTYDHNVWGGDIMQKQDAMEQVAANGWNVFEPDPLIYVK